MPFDSGYALGPSQMQSNDFTFIGYQNTKISFSNSKKSWSIEILQDSNNTATTTSILPPFGTQEYSLSASLGGGHILLNINGCDESKQYNCEDGNCIDSEKRCDSKIDCFDASDENDCKKILFPKAYLKHIPGNSTMNYIFPFVYTMLGPLIHLIRIISLFSAQSRNQDKMAIRLDLDIWAVISISEVDELFSVKFKVTMTWVDPRLTFLNLKKG